MFNLKRKLVAAAMMACIASGGVFAQKGEDKRPKKDTGKIVVKPKGEEKPRPRDDDNRDKRRDDKRGRP
jgi:hypothetical protein